MKNADIPKWTIWAFVGGLLVFFALFMSMFSYDIFGIFSYGYTGTEMLNDSPELTWGKFFPLAAAVLGIVVAFVAMIAAGKAYEFPQLKIIVAVLVVLILVCTFVYFVTVSTGTIIDWDYLTEGTGYAVDQLKAYSSYGVGTGGYIMLLGALISSVGAILSFNDE